jgi:hypothetical protein
MSAGFDQYELSLKPGLYQIRALKPVSASFIKSETKQVPFGTLSPQKAAVHRREILRYGKGGRSTW